MQEPHVPTGREGTARAGDNQRTELRRWQLTEFRHRSLHSITHLHSHGIQAAWPVQRQYLHAALCISIRLDSYCCAESL